MPAARPLPVLALSALLLGGCDPAASGLARLFRPRATWVRGDDPRVRVEGRFVRSTDGPRFAWPAATVHLRFRGKSLDVRLGDSLTADLVRDHDALGVFVDGQLTRRLTLREGSADYRVAEKLPDREHTVSLVKLTEAEAGTVTLEGVSTDGALLPALAARPRRWLAIGDSIMAGYGVDGPPGCHYDARFANAARSWVTRAAVASGAELQLLAWSGRGLVWNNNPIAVGVLPELIERALPADPASTFDWSSYVPDDVVVNTGTNDLTHAGYDPAAFATAYRRLLDRVRAAYPQARVLLTLGPLISDDDPAPGTGRLRAMRTLVQGLVEERTRAGDGHVRFLELEPATAAEGYGCDQHPSAATHARLAGLLAQALGEDW